MTANAPRPTSSGVAVSDAYIVHALQQYSSRYWARVSGADAGLPPHVNGHDEFAQQWTRDMLASLRRLHSGVFHQAFTAPGFPSVPAQSAGLNVVVAVPGSRRPDRAIVLAAHYDGEPTSLGSAYDDTSGCAVLLAVARELGQYWREHGNPSITVEFVLFDAEEQGLVGSNAYAFALNTGAIMPKPLLVIDEEQNGTGYPVRPFGLLRAMPARINALTYTRIPGKIAQLYTHVSPEDTAAEAQLAAQVKLARRAAFARLHRRYSELSYRGGKAPVFRPSDERYMQIGPRDLCCSDNLPFEALGISTLTLSGNYNYYSASSANRGLSFEFPYDQPQDTLGALACDTGGSPTPSSALVAALNLPALVTSQLVRTRAPSGRGHGLTIFSSVPGGRVPVAFTEIGVTGRATWTFGDGGSAAGRSVTHLFAGPGQFRVTVRDDAQSHVRFIKVPAQSPEFHNPFFPAHPPALIPWHPKELAASRGCHG